MLSIKDLHDYQVTSYRHIVDNTHCGLFLGMGLGKTISTLTAVKVLKYGDLSIDKALIIAPKRVAENVWTDEIKKWGHVKNLKISVIAGSEKQRKKAIAEEADIYTIGRDNVSWLCGLYGGYMLPFDMVVVDESSSFKNHASKRFKALKAAISAVGRVVILTATPAPNSLIDLWPQIFLLDRGERLERNITSYRTTYFKPGMSKGEIVYNYTLKKGMDDVIYTKISDLCISMRSEDYLTLPGVIHNEIRVPFTPEVQAMYDEFEKEAVLDLYGDPESEISAMNAAALSNKLLQFANGAVYDTDKNFHVVHDLKLDALEELIEEACGNPILVGWTYRSDMIRIMERFKHLKPRNLDGGKDIEDWNAGKIQLLLMHPASGGHGLNLQTGGSIIVWFGQTWSLELYDQFNGRIDRQGKTQVTVINQLIASKTMDEDVIKSQKAKAKGQNALIDAVKYRKEKYLK